MDRILRDDSNDLFVQQGGGMELKSNCGSRSAWRRTVVALSAIGALHSSLRCSKGQIAILSPSGKALLRPVVKSGYYIHFCRAVGAQLIGNDPLWNKAIALYQYHQQALGRPLVAPLLQDFFEDGPTLIDCASAPEFLSSAFHNELFQIPASARSRLSALQIAGDLGPEFGNPTSVYLIGYVNSTREQYFFNFTQAQVKSQVKPNRVSNYLWWKTVTHAAVIWCFHRGNLRTTRHAGNRSRVDVTTPMFVPGSTSRVSSIPARHYSVQDQIQMGIEKLRSVD